MFNSIAKIQTWGTEAGYIYGVRNFLSASIRAENVGHAAVEVQFPVSEENDRLIAQYCEKIPHQKKTIINADGQEEDIHIVRFSFVPSHEHPFELIKTYVDDCLYEHSGHQTTNRHALEAATFPERRSRTRNIKVFETSTLTAKGRALDFGTAKGKCVLTIQKVRNLDEQLKTAKLLSDKLTDKKSISKKNSKDVTIFLAANALNIAFGDHEISSSVALEALNKKVEEITAQLQQLKEESNRLIPMLKKEGELKLIEGLSAQHKSSQATILHDKLTDISEVLKKALDLSYREDINKDELISSLEQLIKDNPVILDFEQDYGLIQYITKLSAANNAPEIDITDIKKSMQNYLPAISSLVNVDTNRCDTDIEKSNDITNWNLSDYLHAGRPPDGEITLPIGNSNTNKENRRELHLESMLQQMQQIADSSHSYQFLTNNCSVTAMSIINAGMNASSQEHKPTSWFYMPTTPQMVFNKATQIRDTFCKQMTNESLVNLDQHYATHGIKPLERQYNDLDKAIIGFAVDTIFPDEIDKKNGVFYRFTEDLRGALERQENTLISTELLHDLWGIVPERSLPLTKDGSLTLPIDQNLTVGDLMQGLTVLAEINSEKRLTASANAEKTQMYRSKVNVIKSDAPSTDVQPIDETNKRVLNSP